MEDGGWRIGGAKKSYESSRGIIAAMGTVKKQEFGTRLRPADAGRVLVGI